MDLHVSSVAPKDGYDSGKEPTTTQFAESEVLRTAHKDIKPDLDPPGIFPAPLIVQPPLAHKQTFIILHGRGSFAARFGPPLLAMASSDGERLQDAFPHAKIVFVTAPRSKAKIYKKALTHQWFDNWHLEDYTKKQDLMSDGLKKSCRHIHEILREEVSLIGEKNVALWGLSQGCATSLSALLTWDGEPFAAIIGMCGWLPYSNVIKEIGGGQICMYDSPDDLFAQDDDPFNHSDNGNDNNGGVSLEGKKDLAMQAVEYFREEIQLKDKTGIVFKGVPIFLGHGTEDDRVSIDLGREAKACLDLIGAEAQLFEYEGLGHWYSPDMLHDVFGFLKNKLGK